MGKASRPITDMQLEINFIDIMKRNDERPYIFYLLTRHSAFRCSDILPLNVKQIKEFIKLKEINIQEQKTKNRRGKESRNIPIDSKLIPILQNYIIGKYDYMPMFPSRKQPYKHMSYRQMQRLLVKYATMVGLKDIGTHTGRKTASRWIYLNNNKDIAPVKRFLKHESVRDTYRYACIEKEDMEELVKQGNSPLNYM